MDKIDTSKFQSLAIWAIGKPYLFGVKWDIPDPSPEGPVDCSGFARWILNQCGIVVPDGSDNQYEATKPTISPTIGDLGFEKLPNQPTDHVILIFDDWDAIEARGAPYDKIILRSRARWQSWPTFTGWRTL